MSTPPALPPVPTDHPDRDLLYQLEDAIQKLASLPGDDWQWTVLRAGPGSERYVPEILANREAILKGSVIRDKYNSATAFGYFVFCDNAPDRSETASRMCAKELADSFEELGKVGLLLMNRPFVSDRTDDLCRGFSGYAADTFWLFFVAGLSQQDDGPIPRVWQFESELGLRTLTASDIRDEIMQAAIPDLPKDWIDSPPNDYFSFVFPAFGRTSVRVGRWLFDRLIEELPAASTTPRNVNRNQRKTAQAIVCELIDWDTVRNEEQIERSLQILADQARQVCDSLTANTTEDPSIRRPLRELDERVRMGTTHPLHKAVETQSSV